MFLMQKNYSAGSDGFLSYCTSYGDYIFPTVVEVLVHILSLNNKNGNVIEVLGKICRKP